jgi:hypothetical protein
MTYLFLLLLLPLVLDILLSLLPDLLQLVLGLRAQADLAQVVDKLEHGGDETKSIRRMTARRRSEAQDDVFLLVFSSDRLRGALTGLVGNLRGVSA